MRPIQRTKMIKVYCDRCGYTARTTRLWLDRYGAPICPCTDRYRMTVSRKSLAKAMGIV